MYDACKPASEQHNTPRRTCTTKVQVQRYLSLPLEPFARVGSLSQHPVAWIPAWALNVGIPQSRQAVVCRSGGHLRDEKVPA